MPHFIHDTCIGCTACAKLCPTQCIHGASQVFHVIESSLCIDCNVCGNVCPVACIVDNEGVTVPKVKLKEKLHAFVEVENCTGCEFCVDHCPYDAITMWDGPSAYGAGHDRENGNLGMGGVQPQQVAWVDEDICTACRLCEEVCIKNAIVVDGKMDQFNRILERYGDAIPLIAAIEEAERLAEEGAKAAGIETGAEAGATF